MTPDERQIKQNGVRYYNRQSLRIAYRIDRGQMVIFWNDGFTTWETLESAAANWTKDIEAAKAARIKLLKSEIESIEKYC